MARLYDCLHLFIYLLVCQETDLAEIFGGSLDLTQYCIQLIRIWWKTVLSPGKYGKK